MHLKKRLLMPRQIRWQRALPWLCLLVIVGMWAAANFGPPATARSAQQHAIAGRVIDQQGIPVEGAHVTLHASDNDGALDETETQPDGSFLLHIPDEQTATHLWVDISRAHFRGKQLTIDESQVAILLSQGSIVLEDTVLARHLGLSFWVTTAAFVGMLVIIATEKVHRTLAALLAMVTIFVFSLVGGGISGEFFIFDFEHALEYIDFDVIFLLMGMMIVIGVIEETGIFQWLAYQAYRLSRGHVWLLSIILMIVTAVTSAFLDNVTTMLLMAPITLQIALAVGINPLSLLIPQVLASNVGGLATLIGEPTNILIGSYAGFGFNDFVTNLTPGVVLAMLGLMGYVLLRFRKEYRSGGGGLSPKLLEQLRHNAEITDPLKLKKAGIVFGVLMLLFIFGETIHLPPAIAALTGAVAMLLWVHPDIEEMISVVDWTTLIFFIGLFMVIGAVQEVGLISMIASSLGRLVGDNLMLASLTTVWSAAILSGVIDNVPFTAAMLPVADFLTTSIPGAGNMVLFWALAIGAAMGGNATLIGASANLVTAGIADRAGYPVTFKEFLSVGLPSVLVTTVLGSIWLLIRYF